jgi:hypothetical protein
MSDDAPAPAETVPADPPVVLHYSTFRQRPDPDRIYNRCLQWLTNSICILGFIELSLPLWREDTQWIFAVLMAWILLAVAAIPAAILHLRSRRPAAVRTLFWLNVLLMLIYPVGTGLGIYYLRHFARRRKADVLVTVDPIQRSDL